MINWRDLFVRAAKTFGQGFVAVLALIAVPALYAIVDTVSAGGEVTIDVGFWSSVGIASVAGGLAGLVSLAQNLLGATVFGRK